MRAAILGIKRTLWSLEKIMSINLNRNIEVLDGCFLFSSKALRFKLKLGPVAVPRVTYM